LPKILEYKGFRFTVGEKGRILMKEWRGKRIVLWVVVAGWFSIGIMIHTGITNSATVKEPIQKSSAGFAEIDSQKNNFVLVGDTQSTSHWEFWRERNDRERKLIIDEISRHEPAFVIHLGDLTTRGSSKKHWQQFDDFHKELREKGIPFFPVFGNHEFYGNNKKASENYFERFPHLAQKRWYRFTWKNISLIMIDSNFSTLTKRQVELQSQWYLNELQRMEEDGGMDVIIVCCHESPFTNSRVISPNEEVKIRFADPFLRFQKTRLFFSGHSHSYERFQIKNKFFIVSGGGGGPRHKVYIDPLTRPYPDLFQGPELRFFHFCEIERQDERLVLRVLRLEPVGTFTIAETLDIPKIER
jgi:predicted MPP superfamily phosphohydrolase